MRDNDKPWKESWASKMLLNKQVFSFVLLMPGSFWDFVHLIEVSMLCLIPKFGPKKPHSHGPNQASQPTCCTVQESWDGHRAIFGSPSHRQLILGAASRLTHSLTSGFSSSHTRATTKDIRLNFRFAGVAKEKFWKMSFWKDICLDQLRAIKNKFWNVKIPFL